MLNRLYCVLYEIMILWFVGIELYFVGEFRRRWDMDCIMWGELVVWEVVVDGNVWVEFREEVGVEFVIYFGGVYFEG